MFEMGSPPPFYSDPLCQLYWGDNRLLAPALGPHDLLLTDPPYGIGADQAASKNKGRWGWRNYGATDWDKRRPPRWLIEMLMASWGSVQSGSKS